MGLYRPTQQAEVVNKHLTFSMSCWIEIVLGWCSYCPVRVRFELTGWADNVTAALEVWRHTVISSAIVDDVTDTWHVLQVYVTYIKMSFCERDSGIPRTGVSASTMSEMTWPAMWLHPYYNTGPSLLPQSLIMFLRIIVIPYLLVCRWTNTSSARCLTVRFVVS